MMNEDESRVLLEDFIYWHTQSSSYRDDYVAAHKAVLDAMTHSETIAEQQTEIKRLRQGLDDYAVHYSGCKVWKHAESTPAATKCTCGLDEVLK